jgi:hypothetical protein
VSLLADRNRFYARVAPPEYAMVRRRYDEGRVAIAASNKVAKKTYRRIAVTSVKRV